MSNPSPHRLDPTRSAQLLRAVIESAPAAMVMVDALGRIALLNAETEKLFGYERDELLGQAVEVLLPERFRAGHPRSRDAFFAGPQARRMGGGRDLYARRKDGTEFPVEIGLNPVVTDEGTFVLSAIVDISERQRMEQEQRLLSSLVETVEDYAIVMLDPNGIVTTWNAGAERIKGYRADEIIGRHFSIFFTPEELEQRRPEMELATARAAGRHVAEGWRIRRDGSGFWAHVTFTVLRDRSGELIGYSKITRDLTEQRRAERRFRATIESAPTAMVMIEAGGRIVLLNAETEKLFGYERNELLQAPVELLLPERFRAGHPQLREAFFARPEARSMGAGRDLFGLRKDGSEFPIEIGLNPVETDEGLFVLSAIVDITERKQLEDRQRKLNQELEQRVEERTAELEVARDAAQEANRAKSEFLANMSHEIRTPLNAVIGLTEAILRTELTETQRDHLRTVMDSGESLLNVINDILDFAKIEAGKLNVDRIPFDLHDLVAGTLRSQAIRAQHRGVELAYFVDPRLPSGRIGDPARLRQVITNLVGNAIKFTDHGEVVVRVEREASRAEDWLRFAVRDTGIGIDPDQLDRLFLPFEQADSSTTRQHGGTGLGLTISRQLVEMMGGRIGAVSAPGEGSTFYFTVKVEVPEALRDAEPRRAPGLAGTPVLIVDDHSASRDILAEILRAWRMRPVATASVEEAVAQLERALAAGDPFPLVLADVDMPDRGGLALAERIRQDERFDALEIVLMVPAEPTGALDRSGEHRAAARLKKPIKQSELRRAMARALGSEGFEDLGERFRQDARATGGRPAPDRADLAVPPQRILLVEDSVPNQKVARAILGGQGHALVVAANGREALDVLAEQDFDLVLMDVQMPEMDGFEATAAIRAAEAASGRHLPIIAMTAHALQGDREKCLAAGMDDYVVKPIRRGDLFRALARVKGLAPRADATSD